MSIRLATADDAAQICAIYNWYIENTIITFEEIPVTVPQMQQRIGGSSAQRPWLVLTEQERILGYAYAGEWKSRHSYRFTAETTVYVDKDCKGQGIGWRLYQDLLQRLRQASVHALLAGIALPNAHSVALHEKAGFRQVAQLKEVGWKFNQWIDVGYWELILDRQEQST